MKNQINGYDGYIWRGLMTAVIQQAVIDAKSERPDIALDAALWLVSTDLPLWVEAIGMPDLNGVKLVTSGQARRFRSKEK